MATAYLIQFVALMLLVSISLQQQPKLAQRVKVNKPAFINLVENSDTKSWSAAVSSFNGVPFSSDNLYYFPSLKVNGSSPTYQTLNTDSVHWPNEVTYVIESLLHKDFDKFGGIIAATGFLVPTKTKGSIYYYPFADATRSKVIASAPLDLVQLAQSSHFKSSSNNDWFYHRVRYVDMNGDGIKDLLTCRSYKPLVGSTSQEMVALLIDGNRKLTERVIAKDACDVFFDVIDIDRDGKNEIIAAGFFLQTLNVIYSEAPRNNFLNSVVVKTVVQDIGAVFDVKIFDLDKDGYDDIVVTNHQGNKDSVKGSLFMFQVPEGKFKTGSWTKNVLYNDFPVVHSGFKQAAPGSAVIFYPTPDAARFGPAWIALAGDGSSQAYVFAPKTTTQPLKYALVWNNTWPGATVGGLAVQDINHDGYAELFIPTYETDSFDVYIFAP